MACMISGTAASLFCGEQSPGSNCDSSTFIVLCAFKNLLRPSRLFRRWMQPWTMPRLPFNEPKSPRPSHVYGLRPLRKSSNRESQLHPQRRAEVVRRLPAGCWDDFLAHLDVACNNARQARDCLCNLTHVYTWFREHYRISSLQEARFFPCLLQA